MQRVQGFNRIFKLLLPKQNLGRSPKIVVHIRSAPERTLRNSA